MKRKPYIFLTPAVGLVLIVVIIFSFIKNNHSDKENIVNVSDDDSTGTISDKISDNVITWGVGTSIMISDAALDTFNQELYKRGYDFRLEIIPFDQLNFYDEMADYVSTNGPLDICSAGFSAVDNMEKPLELVKSDFFLPLDDLLTTEEGKKLVNLYDEKLWDSVKVDGITYTVPNGWQKTAGAVYAFNKNYIREEELKDFQGTMEELEPFMKKIPKKDGFSHIIYNINDLHSEYQLPFDYRYGLVLSYDGKGAVNPYKNGAFCDLLKTLHNYYTNGYISYDLSLKMSNYSKTSGVVTKMLEEGNFFVYIATNIEFEAPRNNIGTDVILYKTTPYVKSRVLGSTGISKNSKHQKEAFTLLALAYTDETLANLLVYGIEGTEYELRDGVAYAIGGGETKESSNQFALGIYEMTYPNSIEIFKTDRLTDKKEYLKNKAKPSPYISFNFYGPEFTSTQNKINKIVIDNLDIWKSDDIEAEYARVNELLEDAGINELIDAVNEQWNQYKAGLGD